MLKGSLDGNLLVFIGSLEYCHKPWMFMENTIYRRVYKGFVDLKQNTKWNDEMKE